VPWPGGASPVASTRGRPCAFLSSVIVPPSWPGPTCAVGWAQAPAWAAAHAVGAGWTRPPAAAGRALVGYQQLRNVKRPPRWAGAVSGETSWLTLVWAVLDLYVGHERPHLTRIGYEASDQPFPAGDGRIDSPRRNRPAADVQRLKNAAAFAERSPDQAPSEPAVAAHRSVGGLPTRAVGLSAGTCRVLGASCRRVIRTRRRR
jgi:hypothetical protein